LYQHIISLQYFKVISITVLAPSDFSALKNLYENLCMKSFKILSMIQNNQ